MFQPMPIINGINYSYNADPLTTSEADRQSAMEHIIAQMKASNQNYCSAVVRYADGSRFLYTIANDGGSSIYEIIEVVYGLTGSAQLASRAMTFWYRSNGTYNRRWNLQSSTAITPSKTYTTNSYVSQTEFTNNFNVTLKNGIYVINADITLTSNMPANTSGIQIGKITSHWNPKFDVIGILPSQNGSGGNLYFNIGKSTGNVNVGNYSTVASDKYYHSSFCVPLDD